LRALRAGRRKIRACNLRRAAQSSKSLAGIVLMLELVETERLCRAAFVHLAFVDLRAWEDGKGWAGRLLGKRSLGQKQG